MLAEANTEKVWSEPKNLLLYIGIGWVLMGVTSIILPP